MNLRRYFDRVVLINLRRRPDRLAQVQTALRECRWPFRRPEIFAAVDGHETMPPQGWQSGRGAWGAMCSHRAVLQSAMNDGVKRLLVLEDDVCFGDNFRMRVEDFLRAVPADWEQLMFGGAHINEVGAPVLVKPGVYRCADCERMHCYAIRGEFMRKLHERLLGGGKFKGTVHCDWILGRDPEMQLAHKVYAPEFFLVGQERSKSDINGRSHPRKFWNPPGPELPVINLHAPLRIGPELYQRGFYTGVGSAAGGSVDRKLARIFTETRHDPDARVRRLHEWIKENQWEVAGDPGMVCTVWHPEALPALVKAASLWRVLDITASTASDAFRQLPNKLQRRLARAAVGVSKTA